MSPQTKLEEAGEAEEAGGREDDNLVVLAVTVKDEHEDIDISALDDSEYVTNLRFTSVSFTLKASGSWHRTFYFPGSLLF